MNDHVISDTIIVLVFSEKADQSKQGNLFFSHIIALSPISPVRLQLHDPIYLPDSFVLMLRYCANLKAISYESTSLNRIVADKSHRVIVP